LRIVDERRAEKHALALDARRRQADLERGAMTLAPALRADNAAVRLHEALDDREPEPQPSVLAGRRGVALAEPLEDMREELGPDAVASVGDGDMDLGPDARQTNADLAAVGRELDRVGE